MLLKKKQSGRSRSQPKLECLPLAKGLRCAGSFSATGLKKAKHTPTQSCLMEPGIRNHKQRRSLQDLTNYCPTPFKRLSKKRDEPWVNQFAFEMEIGQGAFGEVWKIRDKKGNLKALKAMHKTKIIAKNSRIMVINQRNLLTQLQHNPFVVNCFEAAQDEQHLYLLMEYMPGGDLRYLMYRFRRRFSEGQTKFLICCLIVALEHLHQNGIIHRDVKPENLVIDSQGYLRITDLGISKTLNAKPENDSSGTPAYMAPEAFQSRQLSVSLDYYSIGVVTFELLNGKRPFESKTRQGILDEIKKAKELTFNEGISNEAIDFTKGLLTKDPAKRLGSKGVQELFNHRWFQGVNWAEFKKKKYTSPFKHQLCVSSSLQQYNQKIECQPPPKDQYRYYITEDMFRGYEYRPK